MCTGTSIFMGSNIIFNFFSSQGALGNGTGLDFVLKARSLLPFKQELDASGIGFEEEDDWEDWEGWCNDSTSGDRKDAISANASALSG